MVMTGEELRERNASEDRGPPRPWVLCVHFDIKEGCEAEFIEKVTVPIDAMRHEKSFLSFSMCSHPSEPGRFFFHEIWESREEFMAVQRHRDYRHGYYARLQDLLRSPLLFDECYEMRADYAVHARR